MNRPTLALICGTFFAVIPALAEPITEYGTSGDWKILIDEAKGNGCYAEKTFDDGLLVQMGYWPSRDGGFFGAYHAGWAEGLQFEEGSKHKVKFDFPDKRFSGESEQHMLGDLPGGFVFFDNPNVPEEIAKNTEMTIFAENIPDVPVSLAGTSNAIKLARECQEKQPD